MANITPESFLLHLPTAQRQVAKRLQKELMKINPDYEQLCAWKGLAFKLGQNYSCMICPYKDHIKLMIWRGVDVEDPEKRLLGKGENTRHLLIKTEGDICAEYLEFLLQQQFALYAAGVPCQDSCDARRGMAMPDAIKTTLEECNLLAAYEARPPYQRRDYLYWITSAKREATRQSRLQQMLTELEKGDVYRKMPWGRRG